jgi:hypothetical protein
VEITEKDIANMCNKAAALRGEILNRTIFIERSIDQFIGSYFCEIEDKKDDLLLWIVCERMTFDLKKQLFEYLLKKTVPDFYERNKNDIAFLSSIMEERNILAHYLLNTTEDGVRRFVEKKELTFAKFKNKFDLKPFGEAEYNILKSKIIKIEKMFEGGIKN